ncbi:MAG: hypothetical protein OQK05_03125 [Pseudopelagicola sp.]|nr:hypothetical protein [Pseudopelagicola sp.]
MGIGNVGLPGLFLFFILIVVIVLILRLSGRKKKTDQARIADALERIAETQKTDEEKH